MPVDDLPTFVFPQSIQLSCDLLTRSYPLPDFSTLVFTDIKGRYLYTTCLRFFEPISHEIISPIFHEIYGKSFNEEIQSDIRFYCPKIICVSSQYPFYR